jgi:hypothetical protein
MVASSLRTSLELAAEGGTIHLFCGFEGSKERRKRQGYRTYSGAKCSIVGNWFIAKADCLLKRTVKRQNSTEPPILLKVLNFFSTYSTN